MVVRCLYKTKQEMLMINEYKDYSHLKKYLNKPIKYKELCEITGYIEEGENLPKGKRRYDILKNIKQYIKLEEAEHKTFIITGFYSKENYKPLPSHGKYKTYICGSLLKHLQIEQNPKTLTYSEIYIISGMVNYNFKYARYNYHEDRWVDKFIYDKIPYFEDNIDVKVNIINCLKSFFLIVPDILNRTIKSALENNNKFWSYKKSYRLFRKKEIETPEGKKYIIEKHDCPSEQYEEIETFIKQTLKDVGCKKENDLIYNHEKYKTYKEKVDTYILKKHKYDYYGKTLIFELSTNLKLKNDELPNCKRLLNDNIQKKLKKSRSLNERIPEKLLERFIDEFIKV